MQICYYRTTKVVRVGDELLWNFPPVQNYKYKKFDAANPQLSLSCQWDSNIPDVPLPKKETTHPKVLTQRGGRGAMRGGSGSQREPLKNTPATVERSAAATASRGSKRLSNVNRPQAFVPESNPYGQSHDALHQRDQGGASSGSDDNDEEDDDSELSPQSSDSEDEHRILLQQPVYPEFTFPIHDKKRKIQVTWEVQNVVSSDVAANPFTGQPKLNWRAIGLSNSLTRPKTELECFLLMDVPVSSLVEGRSILGMTNASIRADAHRRGSDLSKLVLCARVIFPPFIFTASCVQCRGEWYKMIGVLLAHNLEHVHGVFGSMWNKEERPGMITRPPNFGERFGVSLNRWPIITPLNPYHSAL